MEIYHDCRHFTVRRKPKPSLTDMTFMEFLVVLLASPLVVTLLYGSYRFHTDPDGERPVNAPLRPRLKPFAKAVQPRRNLSTAAAT